MEPQALPTAVQAPEYESTWNNMGGYADHHAVPGRVCSSVRVARKKGSSHSNIPQYDTTDLRNDVEITDHNQPADRPACSQNKDLQEVSTLLLSNRNLHQVYFISHGVTSYVCDLP